MDFAEVRMEATWEADLLALVAIEHAELRDMFNYTWADCDVEVWRYDSRKVKSA
jgi:hypothetical protein